MSLVTDLVSRFRPPVLWREGEPLDHNKLNAMTRGLVRLVTVGPGLRKAESVDGSQVNISLEQRQNPTDSFWALIQSSSQDGSNQRWTYTVKRAVKTGAAWDGWTEADDANDATAYNTVEVLNGPASTRLGNGVDPANLPAGFEVQPAPDGLPVKVWTLSANDEDGEPVTELWFAYENGVDGECP